MITVRVQNFQAVKDITIEISGFVSLVGPTHSGKSSFMRAIDTALYNRVPPHNFIRVGSEFTQVNLSLPEGEWIWSRTNKSSASIVFNGHKHDKLGAGIPTSLLEEINLTPVVVEGNVFKPNFQRQLSSIFGVGEDQSASTLFSLMLAFSSYDQLPVVNREVDKDLKEASRDRTKAEGVIEHLSNLTSSLEFSLKEFSNNKALFNDFLKLEREVDLFNSASNILLSLNSIDDALLGLDELLDNISTLSSDSEDFISIFNTSIDLDTVSSSLDLVETSISISSISYSLSESYTQLTIDIDKYRESESLLSDLNKSIEEYNFLVDKIESAQSEIDDLNNQLSEFVACPECGAPVVNGVYNQEK